MCIPSRHSSVRCYPTAAVPVPCSHSSKTYLPSHPQIRHNHHTVTSADVCILHRSLYSVVCSTQGGVSWDRQLSTTTGGDLSYCSDLGGQARALSRSADLRLLYHRRLVMEPWCLVQSTTARYAPLKDASIDARRSQPKPRGHRALEAFGKRHSKQQSMDTFNSCASVRASVPPWLRGPCDRQDGRF